MALEDLGNLGEFIGGMAVIATLVYLAIQIRQNNKLLRRSAEQTSRSDSTAAIALAAQSPENAAVYHKGLADPDALSPEERTHFYLFMAANFYHLHFGHTAYQDGAQSEDSWKLQLQGLQFFVSRPGVRTWWEQQGSGLFGPGSDFWHLVDSEWRKYEEPAAQHLSGPRLSMGNDVP